MPISKAIQLKYKTKKAQERHHPLSAHSTAADEAARKHLVPGEERQEQ